MIQHAVLTETIASASIVYFSAKPQPLSQGLNARTLQHSDVNYVAPLMRDKVKFLPATQHVPMKITTVLGAIAVIVLLFFGLIFVMSAGSVALTSEQQVLRLIEGAILLIIGFAIAYVTYIFSRKPETVVHQLELSGQMKAAALKCPNCSASVDAKQIRIVSGVPYATCPYCGSTFEVTEEPKW